MPFRGRARQFSPSRQNIFKPHEQISQHPPPMLLGHNIETRMLDSGQEPGKLAFPRRLLGQSGMAGKY